MSKVVSLEIERIRAQMLEAERAGDDKRLAELQREFLELQKKLKGVA